MIGPYEYQHSAKQARIRSPSPSLSSSCQLEPDSYEDALPHPYCAFLEYSLPLSPFPAPAHQLD